MGMAVLQLYKNKYRYPKYSNTITAYGSPLDCTPIGIGFKTGKLRVKGTMADFMTANYLSIVRDGITIYGWIDDVNVINDGMFEVAYTCDPWRTYKSKITLGTQFIKRQPNETFLQDPLLGSTQPYKDAISSSYVIGSTTKRVAVVQVRASTGEVFSNTPVQPSPYQFYLVEYSISAWQDCQPLADLMSALPANGATENIVTIYSIPWIDTSGLVTGNLIVNIENTDPITIAGWKQVTDQTDMTGLLYNETPLVIDNINYLFQSGHAFQIVIPEAGILNIPDEILGHGNIKLRQDIDLFSGACNYMLTTGEVGVDYNIWGQSVRGSSVASIPILSNPEDTYISQNQNSLTTSLIGDVANIAISAGMMGMGPMGKFLGSGLANDFMGKQFGTMGMVSGGVSAMEHMNPEGGGLNVNPPAFLGTALATNFNGMFWLIKTTQHVTNATQVRANYGYPYNMVDDLVFPSAGYIETKSCNVESDGTVPAWAIQDINTLFDNGILVK
jgi:hypothetical protein